MTRNEIMAVWDSIPPQGDPSGKKFAVAFGEALLAKEREACAQVCEHYATALDYGKNEYLRSRECQQAARAIRARGTP